MTMTTMHCRPGGSGAGATDATADVPLIRRVDDVEIPALGVWQLVPASHVAIAPAPDARPIGTSIHAGRLVSTPEVADCEVHLALGSAGAVVFAGRTLRVAATAHATVEWSLSGTVTCEQASAAMSLSLEYQGVYRRAERTWAWFTGSGRISPHGEETREVVVDLLFGAPAQASFSTKASS